MRANACSIFSSVTVFKRNALSSTEVVCKEVQNDEVQNDEVQNDEVQNDEVQFEILVP
jgi:hypothetical protein